MGNADILIVMFVAGIFGRRSIVLGVVLGIITTTVLYFIFNSFELGNFLLKLLAGTFMSIICSGLARVLLPGLKGGDHNRSPFYMGIGGTRSGGFNSGIVYTDEDEKNARLNKDKIR